MRKSNRVVTTTACPCPTTTSPVSVTCPAFSTRTTTTAVAPTTVTTPTTTTPTVDLSSVLASLGLTGAGLAPTAGFPGAVPSVAPTFGGKSAPQQIFASPIDQLAPLNPVAALAATNPAAALSAKSPVLQLFNPAVNPNAALLSFAPGSAPALAVTGKGFNNPFWFGKI